MKPYDDQVEELARAFSIKLKEELGVTKVEEIVNANELENLNNPGDASSICHSHDACDANQIMLDAFQKIYSRPPFFIIDNKDISEELRDQDTKIIDDAWTMASVKKFYLPADKNDFLIRADVYIGGYISESGLALIADIRKYGLARDWNRSAMLKDFIKNYSKEKLSSEILLDWALSILKQEKGR